MEGSLLNALVMIAAVATLIKFALFEWEDVARAWRRVRRHKSKARNKAGRVWTSMR